MSIKSQDTLVPNGPFAIANDIDLGGGVRVMDWDSGMDPVLSTFLSAQVPEGKRKLGQVVRVRDINNSNRILEKELSGTVSVPVWIDNNTVSGLQAVTRTGLGIESGGALTLNANSIDIAAVTFNDPYGRRVVFAGSSSVDFTAAADGTYVVDWDAASESFERVLLSTGLAWRQEMALAVVVRAGGVNTILHDCRIFTGGVDGNLGLTVGGNSTGVQGANFQTVRQAMLFINCYASSQYLPQTLWVLDDTDEGANLIDLSAAEFSGASSRLNGLTISGARVASTGFSRPTISWGVGAVESTTPLFNINGAITALKIEHLGFVYVGTNAANVGTAWLKRPGAGLLVSNCAFLGSELTHIVDFSAGGIGGDSDPGTVFDNCGFEDCVATTGAHFRVAITSTGELSFRNCGFYETSTNIIKYATATPGVRISFQGGRIADFTGSIIGGTTVTTQNGKVELSGVTIAASTGSASIDSSSAKTDLLGCIFETSCSLLGAKLVDHCRISRTSAVLTIDGSNTINSCDFRTGSVTGAIGIIRGSQLNLGTTGILSGVSESNGDEVAYGIYDSYLIKKNGNAQSNTMIDNIEDETVLRLENVRFEYQSASTNTDPMVSFVGANPRLYMRGCYAPIDNRTLMTNLISFSVDGNTEPTGPVLHIEGGRYQCSGNFLAGGVNLVGSGDMKVVGVEVDCGIPFQLDSPVPSHTKNCQISDSRFTINGTAPSAYVYGARQLRVSDNTFEYRSGSGAFTVTFGNSTFDGRQESCQVIGNSWYCNAGWSSVSAVASGYKNAKLCNNTLTIENGTVSSLSLTVTGITTSLVSEISDNAISVEGSTSAAMTVSVSSNKESAVCDNEIYVLSSAGTAAATIDVLSGDEIEVQDNTIRTSGVLPAAVTLTLGSSSSYLVVDGNNVLSSHSVVFTPSGSSIAINGNSFRAGTTLSITGASSGGWSMTGNSLQTTSSDITLDLFLSSDTAILSSNSIKSGNDLFVYVWGTSGISGSFNSNTINSGGAVYVDIGATLTAGGGTIGFAQSGASQNSLNSIDIIQITLRSTKSGICSGNMLRSVSSSPVVAFDGSAGNRSAAVSNSAQGGVPLLSFSGGLTLADQIAAANTGWAAGNITAGVTVDGTNT